MAENDIGRYGQHVKDAAVREDQLKIYGRKYLGDQLVSDTVTVPYGRDFYQQQADEEGSGVTLESDNTGARSRRQAPPEGFIYAIVHGSAYSQFWDRVIDTLSDTYEETEGGVIWSISDEHIKVYGIPRGEGVEKLPDDVETEISTTGYQVCGTTPEQHVIGSVEE